MTRTANFAIVEREPGASITIRDLGPWDRYLTVTNDAERVVQYLHAGGELGTPSRRIRLFCYDSEGNLDELLHDGAGDFQGSKPVYGEDLED